jgi:hypothetical protein
LEFVFNKVFLEHFWEFVFNKVSLEYFLEFVFNKVSLEYFWEFVFGVINPSVVTGSASGTKSTVIPAVGNITKKPK